MQHKLTESDDTADHGTDEPDNPITATHPPDTNRSHATDTDDGRKVLKRFIPPERKVTTSKNTVISLFTKSPRLYTVCALIPILLLGFIGFNYSANRFGFLNSIDLSRSEIKNLVAHSHTFSDTVGSYAPVLQDTADAIHRHKIFVVFKHRRKSNSVANEWIDHFKSIKAKHRTCFYHRLNGCKLHRNVTAVVSLEHSTSQLIDLLVKKQSNLLTYGYPGNIDGNPSLLPGLTFKTQSIRVSNNLALVGDRELTLGLDAGLHFAIPGANDNVRAHSDNPQAISMYADTAAGGPRDARMHAGVHGKSRTVWLDFSPTQIASHTGTQRVELESVFAGVIRYVTNQNYASIATWPEGRKYAAFLAQDTADSFTASGRVAEFFKTNAYPITWYTLSDLAQTHQDISATLAETGEMACHGDNPDLFSRDKISEQLERLARCIKVIRTVTQQTPAGFRPPDEAHNTDTLSAALNAGITHIFTEHSTRSLVPHLKISTDTEQNLISLPRATTDDGDLWGSLKLDRQQSLEKITDELSWIEESGALFGLSFDTRHMSNDDNFDVVKTLAHMLGNDKRIWMNTAGGIAQWWRVRHDLLMGKEVDEALLAHYQPIKLIVDSAGRLQAQPLATLPDKQQLATDDPAVFAQQE